MRLEVLGPLRVVTDRGVLTARDFRRAKPKQLLQVLVLERGHAVSKEALADALWGEQVPPNYPATLETYVSVLRQALEPGGTPRHSVVRTQPGGYQLDLTRVEVDLDDFDAAIAEATGAEPLAALQSLLRALRLVRGRVVEDEPYAEWAAATRTRYADKQVQALVTAGRLSLLTGDPAQALDLAERAVALNPLAEPAYQVQMTAAYSLFRQDEALAAFERCRRLLAQELGVDPLDETVALHLSILRHEDVASLVPSRPSVPVASQRPQSLPLQGREAELRQLTELAARAEKGALSVAMVVGATGVGKTRLVEALASRVPLRPASNRCSDLEAGFPYLALSLALRGVVESAADDRLPGLHVLLDRVEREQDVDRYVRLMVMERLVAALHELPPLLLVLDDAQWADEETIAMIGYLQRRAPSACVMIVLTCDPAVPVSPALRALRPDLRLELSELSEVDVHELAGPSCWPVTGGNPYYVTSWLEARARGLDEPFTPELRERVLGMCWDAGPSAFRLLAAASALDEPTVSVELLASVVDAREHEVAEQLDELIARTLMVPVGDAVAFRSPAVRVVLRGTLSPPRRELVRRAAASFAAAGGQARVLHLDVDPHDSDDVVRLDRTTAHGATQRPSSR